MSRERLKSTTSLKLKPKERERYQEIFKMFDKNKVGSFGVRELRSVMQSYGMHPNELELQDLISEIDTSGNGLVTFDEFVAVFERKMKDSEAEEELREAFKVFDKDGNGFVSLEELRKAMTQMGEKLTNEEVEEMIHEVDMDENGEINYEEFITIMTSAHRTS